MKETVMVSIDASTKATGIAIWVNGKLTGHHLINFSNVKNMEDRLYQMCKNIIEILDTFKPSITYIEDTYVGRNPDTQKQLNRIKGVVFGWCIMNDSYFETMTPSSWRKYISGFPSTRKRDELKAYSVEYVKKYYGIDCTDDVADAILIGEAMLNKYE